MGFTLTRATPNDAHELVELINQLARYEKLSDQARPDAARLARHLAADASPRCEAVVVRDDDGKSVGFALYYWSYSTFLTGWGIYLEDLFVRETHRGRGIGHALLTWLADHAVQQGAERLTWQVLDWNQLAIEFYGRIGAEAMGDWLPMRLEGDRLVQFAASWPQASERLASGG